MKTELKKIRLSKKMTQNNVCEELKKYGHHICRSTYTKYENGSRPLPCEILVALTKCFDTSADEILGIK
ncbi:MAG: helix-turn-helix transcriptional regulator [Acutalibacteraceae bacterium]|nr:helix-turn-helix transcriptional regulator [Acutalibacteraceae bacterium]